MLLFGERHTPTLVVEPLNFHRQGNVVRIKLEVETAAEFRRISDVETS